MKFTHQASRFILATILFANPTGVSYASIGATSSPSNTSAAARVSMKKPNAAVLARMNVAYAQMPLYFEANQGQIDAAVKYAARGPGYRLYLTSNHAVLALENGKKTSSADRHVVHILLKGSNAHPAVQGQGLMAGKSNYLIGNDRQKWHTNVA